MTCTRCGREQPAPASPCESCETRGYRILTSTEGERPIMIVDSHGFKVFSFKVDQDDLAKEILRNLNSPAIQWAEA